MTVYLSLVTHKKYRYDRPDFFKWAGGRKLRFCNHDFSDYRAKKNSARSGCQLQRQSHPHRRRNGGKSRYSLFFNAHTFTHIYYLSPRAGLDSKRLFLTILRAGPDYSTEGAKPDPRIHQHHPADTCRQMRWGGVHLYCAGAPRSRRNVCLRYTSEENQLIKNREAWL